MFLCRFLEIVRNRKVALCFIAASFIPSLVLGDDQTSIAGLAPGYESYESRPDILKVKPKNHPELEKSWTAVKRGQIEAAAELIEMYPSEELYFLARDGELLFDTVRLIAKNDPILSRRIHLLNISRANMRAPHVQDYLAQEGISEASLSAGKRVVLVDTGFSGTIPSVIGESLSPGARERLKTHLLCSSNSKHPSSRVFLTALNPAAPHLYPGSMHATILSYEHMPRYTDRSTGFEKIGGRWQPISPVNSESLDGSVDKNIARAYMDDLASELGRPEVVAQIQQRRELWKKLQALAAREDTSALQTELRALAGEGDSDPFAEAVVRDFFEILEKNAHSKAVFHLSLTDVGLDRPGQMTNQGSNKNKLIKKYPKWTSILENPETGIKNLISQKDFATLGAIADAIYDHEFMILLAKALGTAEPSADVKALVNALIEKGDVETLSALVYHAFSNSHSAQWGENAIKRLIEKGDEDVLFRLAANAFSNPHSLQWGESTIELLINKGNAYVLRALAEHAFSEPHSIQWGESPIRLLIEKADDDVLSDLADRTFSEPHSAKWGGGTIKLLIERAGPKTLFGLSKYAFSKPHFSDAKWDIYKQAVKISERGKRIQFLDEKTHFAAGRANAKAQCVLKVISLITK